MIVSTLHLVDFRKNAPQAPVCAFTIVEEEGSDSCSGAPFKEGLPDVKVSEEMRREVATVHPESPITQLVYTAVPVVDNDGKVVGMVSDNDLLTRGGMRVTISLKRATDREYVRGLHESLENPNRTVSEVMTTDVVTVPPDMILGRAARLMVEKHIKRLPVVDAKASLLESWAGSTY